MALNNMGLSFVFTARDMASGTIRRIDNSFTGLSQRSQFTTRAMQAGFVGVAAALGGVVAGALALRGFFGLANASAEFGQGLAGVGAVTRATTSEMELLRSTAINAGIATQFSPTEAVEGLRNLATAGQTATQATQSLVPVLDLAAGGQLAVGDAANAVVGTLNSYGMAATDAANVTDRLLRITQMTNFQAQDFAVGLSRAAAAGGSFGTSLNDTLISVGLLRNLNIDASSASTAFRESLRRAASDQGAQNAITSTGTVIFDEHTGAMRSLIDIMQDMVVQTADLTEQERNRISVQAFGARGADAFKAVAGATTTVMRDGTQVTLEGADAIAHLRGELEAATGTADDFRETLLDTFEGQKTLLSGTLETLAVVLGGPFARVFAPIVEALTNFLNVFIQVWNAIPEPIQTFIAFMAVATAAAMLFIGAMAGIGIVFALLLPMLPVIAATMAVLTIVMLPVIIAVGALIAVIGTFVFLARRNVGGLGDWFRSVFEKIKLAFNALVMLFSEGRLSAEIWKELNKAENEGVKSFVTSVWKLWLRMKIFFKGVSDGLRKMLNHGRPHIEAFKEAMRALGEAFGFVGDGLDRVSSSDPAGFARSGESMGKTIGKVLLLIVRIATGFIRFWAGFWSKAQEMWEAFSPSFERLGAAFSQSFRLITGGDIENGANGASSGAEKFGKVLATVVVPALALFAELFATVIEWANSFTMKIKFVTGLLDGVAERWAGRSQRMSLAWQNMGDDFRIVTANMLIDLNGLLDNLPSSVRSMFGLGAMTVDTSELERIRDDAMTTRSLRTAVTESAIATITPASRASAEEMSAIERNREAAMARLFAQQASGEGGTFNVNSVLQIDGEVLARAQKRAVRKDSADGFAPVGVDE